MTVNIFGIPHDSLWFLPLSQFKRSSIHVTLLVIDRESESVCIKQRIPVVADLAECLSLAHRPKTMDLVQGPDGYGFLLRQEKLRVSGRIGIPERVGLCLSYCTHHRLNILDFHHGTNLLYSVHILILQRL